MQVQSAPELETDTVWTVGTDTDAAFLAEKVYLYLTDAATPGPNGVGVCPNFLKGGIACFGVLGAFKCPRWVWGPPNVLQCQFGGLQKAQSVFTVANLPASIPVCLYLF